MSCVRSSEGGFPGGLPLRHMWPRSAGVVNVVSGYGSVTSSVLLLYCHMPLSLVYLQKQVSTLQDSECWPV